jgi:hypothetical protein
MKISKNAVLGCIVAVLALPLAGAVSNASATSILTNPGFETGDLTGWSVFGESANSGVTVQSPDNGPSDPGTHNAFMDNHAEAIGLVLKQSTPAGSAAAGLVYYSFDLKLGQAAASGVFFVEIFAEQAGGGVIGTSGLLGNYTPADWTTFSGSFTAPPNTDFLTIQFEAVTGAVVGAISSMHVDNVDLHQDVVPVESSTWGGIKALYN